MVRVEGNLESPRCVSIVNSALDNISEDPDTSTNKRKKGTNTTSSKSGPLSGLLSGGSVNDLEHRVRILTGFGHRGHHTSTLSSR